MTPPEKLYKWWEFMPQEFLPDDVAEETVSAEAARDFLSHAQQIPSWVLQIAPLAALELADATSSEQAT